MAVESVYSPVKLGGLPVVPSICIAAWGYPHILNFITDLRRGISVFEEINDNRNLYIDKNPTDQSSISLQSNEKVPII